MWTQAVKEFVDEVASSSPAPGGGSVAAVAGAQGAALVAMVCRLTIGKKKYESVADEMTQILEKAENLKRQLTDLVEADTRAFDQVMAAFRMPKDDPGQIEKRRLAIQEAYLEAAKVPLQTMKACADGQQLALAVAARGNSNAASDAGVASLMFEAGAQGARLNVLINLPSIEDAAFVESCRREVEETLAKAVSGRSTIMGAVHERIG